MEQGEQDQPMFEVERLTRTERTQRFKASAIANVESEPDDVKDFVQRTSRRYLDAFGSD